MVNREDVEGQIAKSSFASFTELRRRLYWALFFSCRLMLYIPSTFIEFSFLIKHIYLLNFLFCHIFPTLGQQREGVKEGTPQSFVCGMEFIMKYIFKIILQYLFFIFYKNNVKISSMAHS